MIYKFVCTRSYLTKNYIGYLVKWAMLSHIEFNRIMSVLAIVKLTLVFIKSIFACGLLR